MRVYVKRMSPKSSASLSVGSTRRRGVSPQYHSQKPSSTSAKPSVATLRTTRSRAASRGASTRP